MGNDKGGGKKCAQDFGELLCPFMTVFICSDWLLGKEITAKGQALSSENKNRYLKIMKLCLKKIRSH